ncbi:MAG: hypothetical protein MUF83_11065 [Acidimicrobiales bacterium]|nr:hypothetical protein [Acidimicrobiales bacterium]
MSVVAVEAVTVLVAIETVVLVLLVLVVAGLLRSHALILRKLHDLGAGIGDPSSSGRAVTTPVADPVPFRTFPEVPAPEPGDDFVPAADVSGTGLRDDVVAVRVVGVEHPTLLAFLSTGCSTCARFWEAFGRPRELNLPEGTRLVIVAKSIDEESPLRIAELAPAGVTLVASSQAWADYRVPGSPYFVFVDGPTGRVRGEGTGLDWNQVANLLAQATGDLTFTAGPDAARRHKATSDAEREQAIDAQLMAAGLFPGDPSLHQAPGGDEAPERPAP